jgi:type IV pilus assembly protein PilX
MTRTNALKRSFTHPHQQRGVSLFVVLVLLIIMMIAGVALFRSTDIAALIAGNTATKQAATQVGNIGLVEIQKKIVDQTLTAGTPGYTETALAVDANGIPVPAGNVDWTPETPTDAGNGFGYQYIVEKLCNADGVCTQSRIGSEGSNLGDERMPDPPQTIVDLYRVTIKITGPRNTETHVQALYGF